MPFSSFKSTFLEFWKPLEDKVVDLFVKKDQTTLTGQHESFKVIDDLKFDRDRYADADAHRQSTTVRKSFRLIVALSISTLLMFPLINKYLPVLVEMKNGKRLTKYDREKLRRARLNKHITFGKAFLEKDDLGHAYTNFNSALVLEHRNKEAKLGLTKSMILQCVKHYYFCDEAKKSLESLHYWKDVTASEIAELHALWKTRYDELYGD